MVVATIEWRCPVPRLDTVRQLILRWIIQVIEPYGATRVNIRQCIHNMTYGKYDSVQIDPKGNHISGEFLDPLLKKWVNFHLYVIEVGHGDTKTWIWNPKVSPNPEVYRHAASRYEKAMPLTRNGRVDQVSSF